MEISSIEGGIPLEFVNKWGEQRQYRLTWLLLGVIKGLERVGVAWPAFGRLYNCLFYRKMVLKEARLAGLKKGQRVLHIGSGPLPLTALSLAEEGILVEGVDRDPEAVAKAAALVKSLGFQGRITVRKADGLETNGSGFDAIWLSLHVFPKEEILRRALKKLQPGGRLVYRDPRGWLTHFYPRVQPERIAEGYPWRRVQHILGKETVVITKDGVGR